MALFGNMGKPRNPFDFAAQGQTPGFGAGLPNVAPQQDMMPAGLGGLAAPAAKKGLDWARIMGIVSDGLAGAAGQQGTYGPAMMQQKMQERQMQMQQQLYERNRTDSRNDWLERAQYERDNPKPYRWESNDGSLMEMGTDGAPRVVYKDPTAKPQYIQVKDPVTGQLIITNIAGQPTSGAPSMSAPALPQTLTDDDWGDVGGAGPQAPRRFP